MKYDWIDFYTEFATKLLPFKDDRKILIHKINSVYTNAAYRNLKVAMRLLILTPLLSLEPSTRESQMLIESLFLTELRRSLELLQLCRAILMEFRFLII